MRKKRLMPLLATYLALPCLVASPAIADPAQPAAAPTAHIPGWDELVETLRILPQQMLAKLPPEERSDPQVQAEVGRLMLAAVTSSALAALNSDGDHPTFVPLFGQTLNLARPNADTIYRVAEITPGGIYRLRGRRGTLSLAKIGEGGSKEGEGNNYHDINSLNVDAEDRYDVILSPERPVGYKGDWWQLDPATSRLSLRMVSSNWSEQKDPTLSIERLDTPAQRQRPSAIELEQVMRRLPKTIPVIAGLRMGWISKLRREGYLNKFNIMNYSERGLLLGQFYYEAVYDLRDDEALIIETQVPASCGYRSLILTNEMGETIDWINNHSSLNGSQAKPDNDGVLRIVVSRRDPGVPNWLDTAGYAQGGIQGRWTDCSSQPVPSLRKVAVADVRKALPAGTPKVIAAQRDRVIRDRRAAFQQRPLW